MQPPNINKHARRYLFFTLLLQTQRSKDEQGQQSVDFDDHGGV